MGCGRTIRDGNPLLGSGRCGTVRDGNPEAPDSGLELDGYQYALGTNELPVQNSPRAINWVTGGDLPLGGTSGQAIIVPYGGDLNLTVIGNIDEPGRPDADHTLRLYRDIDTNAAGSTLVETLTLLSVPTGETLVFEFSTHTFPTGVVLGITHESDEVYFEQFNWTLIMSEP